MAVNADDDNADKAGTTQPLSRPLHVWADPPDTPFPITTSPVRIAVGTPHGLSSNSWRLWVRGHDVYVACRDNFREFKVSLHASGIWRLGFTETFAKARPDIVPSDRDRAWTKWRPTFDANNRLAIGFQVAVHLSSLYLRPRERRKWPREVVFIEHAGSESILTLMSACVVLGERPLVFAPGTYGAVVAILPMGADRTVQLVASHEEAGNFESVIVDGFRRVSGQLKARQVAMPEGGVFFVHGVRGNHIPYVAAIPFRRLQVSPTP